MKINVKAVNDGVKKVIDIYENNVKESFEFYMKDGDVINEFVKIDGKEYPVFPWRNHAPLPGAQGKAARSIGDRCHMKCSEYEPKTTKINQLLFRETDICEWFFGSKIKHVFALKNGDTINAILDHECGGVSTLELAAVMPEEAEPQGQRRMFAEHGFVCDQPLGHKLSPEAVYLFNNGEHPLTFTDASVDLYGLNLAEIEAVSSVYYMLLGSDDKEEIAAQYARLKALNEKVMAQLNEKGVAEVWA